MTSEHGSRAGTLKEGMKLLARQLYHASTQSPFVGRRPLELLHFSNVKSGIQYQYKNTPHRGNRSSRGRIHASTRPPKSLMKGNQIKSKVRPTLCFQCSSCRSIHSNSSIPRHFSCQGHQRPDSFNHFQSANLTFLEQFLQQLFYQLFC